MPGATARARSRTGRWATTCARLSSRRRSRPATPAALTSTAPSIGSAARHRVRGRRAPRRDQGMPEVQGPNQGPVPRQHPVQYGIGIQALVINLLVAQMLSLRRRARAGDLRHQALRGNLPRLCFHDASWEEAAVAHLLQRPMSTISDQQQVAPCRGTLTCKFPHRKRGREARDRHHPVLQGRPGPRTWASVATSCAVATCCAN